MRDGTQNRIRRAFQQIRKPHQQPALTQPDGIVDVGKREEFYFQLWDGRIRPQFPVGVLKDFEQTFAHGESSLAQNELSS